MTARCGRIALLGALVVAACSDEPAEAGASSTGGIDPTSTPTTDSTGGGDSSGGSEATTTGAPPEDPDYPRPTPVDEVGECPDGFFGPITFDFEGWGCIPECTAGDPPTCPSGQSGTAQGSCATNPLSSAAPCAEDEDCTIEGERCGNVGMDQKGCLLPPSHCLLRCDAGETCPDAMNCSEVLGICQYLP
jgi:hypothetical protein